MYPTRPASSHFCNFQKWFYRGWKKLISVILGFFQCSVKTMPLFSLKTLANISVPIFTKVRNKSKWIDKSLKKSVKLRKAKLTQRILSGVHFLSHAESEGNKLMSNWVCVFFHSHIFFFFFSVTFLAFFGLFSIRLWQISLAAIYLVHLGLCLVQLGLDHTCHHWIKWFQYSGTGDVYCCNYLNFHCYFF